MIADIDKNVGLASIKLLTNLLFLKLLNNFEMNSIAK